MLPVKKLASKIALTLGFSLTCTFIGLPSAASERPTSEPPIRAIVAQADISADTPEPRSTDTEPSDSLNEVSAETRAKIEELLALTNSNELNLQLMEGIIAQFRQISPDVPDEWWDRFAEKIDYDELNEIVIPIYAQNFTNEEIDGIIAFYRTPIGQSVLEKMPMVVQDSLIAGQQWGLSIAAEIVNELEADGYDLPDE